MYAHCKRLSEPDFLLQTTLILRRNFTSPRSLTLKYLVRLSFILVSLDFEFEMISMLST